MKFSVLILLSLLITFPALLFAQSVGIGTNNPAGSAQLEVASTEKGLLVPRMTRTQRTAIPSPAAGLLVYQTGPDSAGFYFHTGTAWEWMRAGAGAWQLTGNDRLTDKVNNYLGTKGPVPLRLIARSENIGLFDPFRENYIIGSNPQLQGIAENNVAFGSWALSDMRSGWANVAIGDGALSNDTSGSQNVAVGSGALTYLRHNQSNNNVAVGSNAGNDIGSGQFNTLVGDLACGYMLKGSYNTSIGARAGAYNQGDSNVFLGNRAGLFSNSSSKLYIENSLADSMNALIYGDFTADSLLLNAKTVVRNSFHVRLNNALEVGYGVSKQADAGKICYGCFGDNYLGIVGAGTSVSGSDRVIKLWSEGGLRIRGNALPDGNGAHSLGQSGTAWSAVWAINGTIQISDARLKTNIHATPYGLREIMQLKPVRYQWITDPAGSLSNGFLAQDLEQLIPEAVVNPGNGETLGVKYAELIPVLVNAIQELKKENERQQERIAALENRQN